MKKIIAILVILAMIAPFTPAVLAIENPNSTPSNPCCWDNESCAGNITTTVTMAGGGGTSDPPIIKCKWEYDLNVSVDLAQCPNCNIPAGCYAQGIWENDACPCELGLQVKPILGGDVYVGYFAVVTDPQGVATVDSVYADVWHPDGLFKYQLELFPLTVPEAVAAWNHVIMCHPDLVTYSDYGLYNESEILEELSQGLAYLYYNEAPINYCQPGGWYKVEIIANDNYDVWSSPLLNYFWYIPTSGIEIDFTQVNYGTIAEDFEVQAGGDQNMGTSNKPTVRNIGNTPIQIWVGQDDMGFGKTGVPPEWNVGFAARLSATGAKVIYEPDEPLVRIPGVLGLCTLEKLDFFITVYKGWAGYTYEGNMSLCAITDGIPVWATPLQFEGFPPSPV
jgi:hypothetical protein